MHDQLPHEWLRQPPEILVVGMGAYAAAFAQILGVSLTSPGILLPTAQDSSRRDEMLVFSRLRSVFLIAAPGESVGDLVALHRGLWDSIVRLSPDQEERRICLVFILPEPFERLAGSLARGLAFPSIEAAGMACSIVATDVPLANLLETAATTPVTDFVAVRGRFRADLRRSVLRRLSEFVLRNEFNIVASEEIRQAAMAVMDAFRNQEYDLDLFCCPPRHPNGNTLRQWLSCAVTGMVTPLEWKEIVAELD